ncbi:MAG: hypothetical protein WDO74_29280 [Pseudomonadota bacterium]
MKTCSLAAGVLWALSLCACDHPAAPAAPAATETPAQVSAAPVTTPTDGAPVPSPAPPRGKRSPCTSDQSCNRDPSVSALWGHCMKDSGVCECNAGFELHPGGYCQPIAK